MYSVTVRRSFVAQHFLTVPDPGPEGELHSHHFTAEVGFHGPELNEYGYLVDIDDVKDAMATVIGRYRDTTLNDQDSFAGKNPSVEHFSRILCEEIVAHAEPEVPTKASVKLWEDDEAWARYETSL
ncbi:6-pyruvoyltetrahydropterin/6-carboxytetrahydropterin synthase [Halogranum gelatinilyticum]|uniref:6-pyruvoyltetrahydropterin/6-carboxytetrahydropterin synthase n=1 Tax=Halogranum gelatinilyticum TaxID=660521 RepID=A0A1H0A3J2_9EURY|nr:6-carboxytetrahydropterin synthase [Halogranum gelatinilyticum]SDN27794.1 6-pyruvoyltetrahydropterin/6-carboxytetrahydropterin synthase [Halogranum gelatinilyticum]